MKDPPTLVGFAYEMSKLNGPPDEGRRRLVTASMNTVLLMEGIKWTAQKIATGYR
ncbi:MAG TPA: hypothetical protein VFF31_05810 [Blastocatellia bacterium]|nr:hypothetical protein [Blastocatellia bacterium]